MAAELEDWARTFDEVFSTPASTVADEVWADVYGDEYPAGLEIYSFTSRSELRLIAEWLAIPRVGGALVDIGCGRGGPGLWVAGATGARLTAIDIAASALESARAQAVRLGLADRAGFQLGSFEATGLPDGFADAIMSVDALLFTPHKEAALRELARIARPGARLVVTTWDFDGQPSNRPPQVSDHRDIAHDAGFDVIAYNDTPHWREYQRAITARLLQRTSDLAAESGESPEQVREGILEMEATMALQRRRVLMVAQRADGQVGTQHLHH
ncbi:class I SAM-dependent methyltransferase [Micromonospora sp. DT81.3]|uniref:class I SAM-dependent methyltransferase n=1 Tax=Actinomycetes TaxID=1760 RepID=UPI003CF7180F